jgi:hypothetical protein
LNEAPLALVAGQFELDSGLYWGAVFATQFDSNPDTRCRTRTSGQCLVIDCRESTSEAEPNSGVSVGPVTIAGGEADDVVLEPDSDGTYPREIGDGEKWTVGTTISFTAPGGDLDGFDVALAMPAPGDFLVPDLETLADGALQVPRTEAFTITWTPVDAAVSVELFEGASGDVNDQDFFDVVCTFDGTAGTGQIAEELMSDFEGGHPQTSIGGATVAVAEQSLGNRVLRTTVSQIVQRSVTFD